MSSSEKTPEVLSDSMNTVPPGSAEVQVGDDSNRVRELLESPSTRVLTCSDGAHTGYALGYIQTGEGKPLCLTLIEGDSYKTTKVFQWIERKDARNIRQAFEKLEDSPETADELRTLIGSHASGVLRWAKSNSGAPLATIPPREQPKQRVLRSFDYEPYENFEHIFTLADGKTVTVKAKPEREDHRICFELKRSDDSAISSSPIPTIDSGKFLAALEALKEDPNAGEILYEGIKNRKLLVDILNIKLY